VIVENFPFDAASIASQTGLKRALFEREQCGASRELRSARLA